MWVCGVNCSDVIYHTWVGHFFIVGQEVLQTLRFSIMGRHFTSRLGYFTAVKTIFEALLLNLVVFE